jgi:transposase InsO family protein
MHLLASPALDLQLLQRIQTIHPLVVHALAGLPDLQIDHPDDWLTVYNTERPHDSLGRVPPLTYLPGETSTGVSRAC